MGIQKTIKATRTVYRERAKQQVGPLITLLAQDVQIGTTVLGRVPNDNPAFPILYRDLLQFLDGCAELVAAGSVHGAFIQGRVILEFALQAMYAPARPDELLYAAMRQVREMLLAPDSAFPPAEVEQFEGVYAKLLQDTAVREVGRAYQKREEERGHAPPWYTLNGGPQSVKALADEVGLPETYGAYCRWSRAVHSYDSAAKAEGRVHDFDGSTTNELIATLHELFVRATGMLIRSDPEAFGLFQRDIKNGAGPILLRAGRRDLYEQSEAILSALTPDPGSAEATMSRGGRGVPPYHPRRARERMSKLMGSSLQRAMSLLAISTIATESFASAGAYETRVARAAFGLHRQVAEGFDALIHLVLAGCLTSASVQLRVLIESAAQLTYLLKKNNEELATACLLQADLEEAWSASGDHLVSAPMPVDLNSLERTVWLAMDGLRQRAGTPVPWYRLNGGPRSLQGLLTAQGQGDTMDNYKALGGVVHRPNLHLTYFSGPVPALRTCETIPWEPIVEGAYLVFTSAEIEFLRYFHPEYLKEWIGFAGHANEMMKKRGLDHVEA